MKTFQLLLVSLCVFSCTQDEIPIGSGERMAKYLSYGDIHNDYLQQVYTSFNTTNIEFNTKQSFTNELKNTYLIKHEDQEIEKIVKEDLESNEYYEYLNHEFLKRKLLSENFSAQLNSLNYENIVDTYELDFITRTINLVNTNDLTWKKMKVFFDSELLKWEKEYSNVDSEQGRFSGIVIGISLRSTEWWMENQHILSSVDSKKLAPWIAADVAGALVTGVISGVAQVKINGSCCDDAWGAAFIAGGIVSSTGLVGKMTRWLVRYF